MNNGMVRVTVGGSVSEWNTGPVLLGRVDEADVSFDSLSVSRRHAQLVASADGWMLEDLGSSGGTWVAGTRVERLQLSGSVEVRLGGTNGGVMIRIDHVPAIGEVAATPDPPVGEAAQADEAVTSLRPITGLTGTFQRRIEPTGSKITAGRSPDNDVVIADLLASRFHLEVTTSTEGSLELVDLDSANGTYLNGHRVTRAALREGDLIGVGRTTFRIVGGELEQYEDQGLVAFEARGVRSTTSSGHVLVDDVSFSLPERTLLAVVGPSGSGKSSLLAALAGVSPASEGLVLYGDRNLYEAYDELRARIGLVPQDDVLHSELRVGQALDYAARLRFPGDVSAEERTARIGEVLDELDLTHRVEVPIDQLSGGERKRTSVAVEMLTKPSLLFLDEPSSGLDPGLARALMRQLRSLATSGHTVVVVTHELANIHLCDQVLVLASGGVPAYFGRPEAAPHHFGEDDLTEVFSAMAEDRERDWRDKREQSPESTSRQSETPKGGSPKSPRSWFSQVIALIQRNVSVLIADRKNLALLLAQAPVLGLLMLAAFPSGELGIPPPQEVRFVSIAGLVLLVMLLGATWLGAGNGIRALARESAVFRRERAVGLSTSAYLTAMFVVLGCLTLLQTSVMVSLATINQHGPTDSIVLGWGLGELMVVVGLAGLGSLASGLLISALSGTPERASSVLPMLLIVQLVLSAGAVLPEIVDKPVLRELSFLSTSQWGVAGSAATVDLNELQQFDDRLRELRTVDAADPSPAIEALTRETKPESRWAHTSSAWFQAVGAIVALTIAMLLGTYLVLRRVSPGRQ